MSTRSARLGIRGLLALAVAAIGVGCRGDDDAVGRAGSAAVMASATAAAAVRDAEGLAVPAASATRGPVLRAPTRTAASVTPSDALASFRVFAGEIDEAVRRGDKAFFAGRALMVREVCQPEDLRGHHGGSCTQVGQAYHGVEFVHWRTNWRTADDGLASVQGLVGFLEQFWTRSVAGASDDWGGSTPGVYAIGETNYEGPTLAAVLTGIVERPKPILAPPAGSERLVVVTHWVEVGGVWRLSAVLSARGFGEDFLEPTAKGRSWMPTWERF